jgi:hypothetical protein
VDRCVAFNQLEQSPIIPSYSGRFFEDLSCVSYGLTFNPRGLPMNSSSTALISFADAGEAEVALIPELEAKKLLDRCYNTFGLRSNQSNHTNCSMN